MLEPSARHGGVVALISPEGLPEVVGAEGFCQFWCEGVLRVEFFSCCLSQYLLSISGRLTLSVSRVQGPFQIEELVLDLFGKTPKNSPYNGTYSTSVGACSEKSIITLWDL